MAAESTVLRMTPRRLALLRAVAARQVFRWPNIPGKIYWSPDPDHYHGVTQTAEALVEAGLIELRPRPAGDGYRWRYGLTTTGEATLLNWAEWALTGAKPSRGTEDQ